MNIYVAAKFEDQQRTREVMQQLRDAGHEITYDWTTNEQVSEEQAIADLHGVVLADALVLIVEKDLNYCGALVELGIALGRGIPVHVIGTALDERCIFMQIGEPSIRRGIDALLPITA